MRHRVLLMIQREQVALWTFQKTADRSKGRDDSSPRRSQVYPLPRAIASSADMLVSRRDLLEFRHFPMHFIVDAEHDAIIFFWIAQLWIELGPHQHLHRRPIAKRGNRIAAISSSWAIVSNIPGTDQ